MRSIDRQLRTPFVVLHNRVLARAVALQGFTPDEAAAYAQGGDVAAERAAALLALCERARSAWTARNVAVAADDGEHAHVRPHIDAVERWRRRGRKLFGLLTYDHRPGDAAAVQLRQLDAILAEDRVRTHSAATALLRRALPALAEAAPLTPDVAALHDEAATLLAASRTHEDAIGDAARDKTVRVAAARDARLDLARALVEVTVRWQFGHERAPDKLRPPDPLPDDDGVMRRPTRRRAEAPPAPEPTPSPAPTADRPSADPAALSLTDLHTVAALIHAGYAVHPTPAGWRAVRGDAAHEAATLDGLRETLLGG